MKALPENEAVRRLHAQYAVARALAESSSLEEAASRILQAICETLGWELRGPVAVDAARGSCGAWRLGTLPGSPSPSSRK